MRFRFFFSGLVLFFLGVCLGLTFAAPAWQVVVNGKPADLPVHIIKNMHFVALSDLAKLPGWTVTVDLGSRNISIVTPEPIKPATRPQAVATEKPEKEAAGAAISASSSNSGPPSDVRMMVGAAMNSLEELRDALKSGGYSESLKEKAEKTNGLVQQAEVLLWNVPRTRTLQADIRVVLDDLLSQVRLLSASEEIHEGVLPWTNPVAHELFLKYPDVRQCRAAKGKYEGMDMPCALKILGDLSAEDFGDVQRDLDQYR